MSNAAPASSKPPVATGTGEADAGLHLHNVGVFNFATGIKIGKGAKVTSSKLQVGGNLIDVDNAGEFDGPDTTFK